MEPSKEAIAVRITRLNRQILGKTTSGTSKLKRTVDRESLLDALTVLYDECNDDPVKKCDDLVKAFVDKYRSTLAELRCTRVCLSDFDIVQTIGRGHFGEVHMVREKQTSDVYAMKVVRKEMAMKRAAGAAEDERDVLATATSPWMPRLQYAFQDASSLYLVMELCSGGDLAGLLSRRNHPLSERDAAFYVAETAHALKALHGMGYVHRDVKPGNILLDRCGHVKLGDFGSCARLSERGGGGEGGAAPVGTADYVAPELLAAAECAARHAVCALTCRGIAKQTAISACDYWSLGVVAFELVTMRRPFSSGDDDSIPRILGNIQKYEREVNSSPPFDPAPSGPSAAWRALVAGLLAVQPDKRYNYLDTLQHAALSHLPTHTIRDQAPPWVPCTRGPEDTSLFHPPPRAPHPPSAAPFRARPPFAGQLPYVGYSYVAPEQNEDTSGGFNSSHDCTAINLATFKSAEKLAAMRGREIASLQSKLAAAESAISAETEKTRRAADAEAERQRARLQAEITALSLQNRRLERQIEVEKEERMALERTNQQLSVSIVDRTNAEVMAAAASAAELRAERDGVREEVRRLEARVAQLQAECARAAAQADAAHQQQKHYKDTIAKERALRRQTLSGGEAECREAGARLAQAEANLAKEKRTREQIEKRLQTIEGENTTLQKEIDEIRRELASSQETLGERRRFADQSTDQLRDAQTQLAHEKARVTALQAQVRELERGIEEAGRREAALEEQCSRTEARFNERLHAAEARAAAALKDDARHREKVNTLEQLVRQLEREVSALESRSCAGCEARADAAGDRRERDGHSDTESVGEGHHVAHTQLAVVKEQLERAEQQLQARADEMAALRQEARTANLARWRKEREYNELSVEAKSTAREVKRLEERLNTAAEARKEAEKKASTLQTELTALKPQYERATRELDRVKEQLEKLKKAHEVVQAEVDRSRNDIRKLKSELQYSEKRRLHAEEQEELSSRERAQLRDELTQARVHNHDLIQARVHNHELIQNNKALQEACSLLEDQLTDLEKLADMHEGKNKHLESETTRMRSELEACRSRLAQAERSAAQQTTAANDFAIQHEQAKEQAHHALCQLALLRDRLESRESRVAELEMRTASLEGEKSAAEAALGSAVRRLRELQEECSALRTRAHEHHSQALQLQASLQDAQEEISAIREASEASNAWWRTRETKADSTLRQQAKLIDFLQAKVEEAGRKKCSLSNKLFGRSGRRPAASPPLRRANRELREEVDRLRAKLSAHTLNGDMGCPTPIRTPRSNARKPADTPNGDVQENKEDTVVVIWPDGSRERVVAKCIDGTLLLCHGDKETKARLVDTDTKHNNTFIPQNEANRAFCIQLDAGSEGVVVCASVSERANWVSRLIPAPAAYAGATLVATPTRPVVALHVANNAIAIGYAAATLVATLTCPVAALHVATNAVAIGNYIANSCSRANWVSRLNPAPASYAGATVIATPTRPVAALHVANNAIAIGSEDGLLSLRGPITLELDSDFSPPRHHSPALTSIVAVAVAGRALAIHSGVLVHCGLLALGSALRRAGHLKPSVAVSRVRLPDVNSPHLVTAVTSGSTDVACAAVACGRRVFLLRYDAAATEFRVARSFTVDRPPAALLLTGAALYIAGEKPLKVNLPSGALEAFAMEEPIISAAAKKHSAPKAILLIREKPTEILLCYSECGVFVDQNGRRTRNDDAKWSSAVRDWEYVAPFLYLVGEEKVTIIHVTDEAYRAPPCTCDSASLASSASECYVPDKFNLKANEPALLGTAPDGVIIRTKVGDTYNVAIVEGKTAFKSIGASIESLSTISDSKRSSTDSAQSSQHYTTVREAYSQHTSNNRVSSQQNNRESYGQNKRESFGQSKNDSYGQTTRESYRQINSELYEQIRRESYGQIKNQSNGQNKRESSGQNKRDSNRRSTSEEAPQDLSRLSLESVEPNTGFLSDIRKRARQLRKKNRKDRSPEDVIKEILTTEVGLKRLSTGRRSPAGISDSESDSEPEQNGSESSSAQGTADLCAEMFSRQVRFQNLKE